MNRKFSILTAVPVIGILFSAHGNVVNAASFTSTISPKVTIQAECEIVFVRNMRFGVHGLLNANINKRRRLRVKCTTGTSFNIGMDGGTTPGGTVANRKMVKGTETVDYNLYQNAARTVIWGDTIGVNTKSSTGTGANQTFRFYGRVPVQTTPSPGTYKDVITVILTF